MILIFGGACQGKTAFAREAFGLSEEEMACCTPLGEPDWSRTAICGLEQYLLGCLQRGEDPAATPLETPLVEGKILLCQEIGSDIVPVDPLMRRWREETGRALQRLARRSDQVWRVFCGIPQRIK